MRSALDTRKPPRKPPSTARGPLPPTARAATRTTPRWTASCAASTVRPPGCSQRGLRGPPRVARADRARRGSPCAPPRASIASGSPSEALRDGFDGRSVVGRRHVPGTLGARTVDEQLDGVGHGQRRHLEDTFGGDAEHVARRRHPGRPRREDEPAAHGGRHLTDGLLAVVEHDEDATARREDLPERLDGVNARAPHRDVRRARELLADASGAAGLGELAEPHLVRELVALLTRSDGRASSFPRPQGPRASRAGRPTRALARAARDRPRARQTPHPSLNRAARDLSGK